MSRRKTRLSSKLSMESNSVDNSKDNYSSMENNQQSNSVSSDSSPGQGNVNIGTDPVLSMLTQMQADQKADRKAMLERLDKIDKKLNSNSESLAEVRLSVENIQKWKADREQFETDFTLKTNEIQIDVNILKQDLQEAKSNLCKLQSNYDSLHEYTLRMECHSRRDNLILDGIPETPGETDHDCYLKLVNVFEQNLQIPRDSDIKIVRCHRLGPSPPPGGHRRPRPIIFKFHWYGDRTLIWSRKHLLAKTDLFLSENFAPVIEQRRRILNPIFKAARAKKMKARLVLDKLVIEGKSYSVSNLDELPGDLDPRKLATPSKNNITAFYSAASPLSNFHAAEIRDADGTVYSTCEQYYQHRKALYHNDDVQATLIMKCKTPHEAYKAGQNIKNQNDSDWYKKDLAKSQMYKCCLAKFDQNDHLKQFLVQTGESVLVEASPWDKRWGVGISMTNPAIFDKAQWGNSQNWMGDILSRIRDELS